MGRDLRRATDLPWRARRAHSQVRWRGAEPYSAGSSSDTRGAEGGRSGGEAPSWRATPAGRMPAANHPRRAVDELGAVRVLVVPRGGGDGRHGPIRTGGLDSTNSSRSALRPKTSDSDSAAGRQVKDQAVGHLHGTAVRDNPPEFREQILGVARGGPMTCRDGATGSGRW